MPQIYEVSDAESGEFCGFEEKAGQGAPKFAPPSAFLLWWLIESLGIRHLVLDH